jgi:ABC-type bacteriocin/lantibiotic exporter with double-glycine peptidase domain
MYYFKLFGLFNKKQKFYTYVAFFAIVIAGLMELLGLGLFYSVFMSMVNEETFMQSKYMQNPYVLKALDILHISGFGDFLITMLIGIIVLFIVKNVYLVLYNIFLQKYTQSLQKDLSVRLFHHYVYMDYQRFFDRNTAEIQRDIYVTPNSAIGLYFMSSMNIINNLIIILLFVGVLFIANPISTAVILGMMILLAIIYMLIANTVGKRTGEIARMSNKKILQWCSQCFGSIAEVKVNGKESYFLGKYRRIYDYYIRAIRKRNIVNSLPKMVLETVAIVGICIVFLVNLQMGKNVSELIPMLGIYFYVFIKLLPYVTTIFGYFMNVKHAQPFVEAMFEHENRLEKTYRKPRSEERLRVSDTIAFDDIVYSYPAAPDKDVLEHISLDIPANSFIGVVGRSGSGKSTLVALLVGLLTPRKGSIKIDGKPLFGDDDTIERWQNNIGYIPQEIRLLDDTILTNVAYGEDKPDIGKVKKALEMAQLGDFVASLPRGLDTRVGQNGAMLSGGQKQRIGIARALYREAEVLVLDEATSSLDYETAQQFTQNIINLKHTLTIISISHKVETLSACDRVYNMESGRLQSVEIG